jgi:GntR family phosphonate transport system transcriptional regulator
MSTVDDRQMTETARGEVLPRGDGIAVWRRIADWIRGVVAAGSLGGGSRLPSETDLAKNFSVNRHTVRRALAALAEEGLVRSAQGRGTFVEPGRLAYPIGTRTRFTEILAAEGHVAGGELVDARSIAATPLIAERLDIPAQAPVLCVKIRRLVDGAPVSISLNYLPLPRFAGFAASFAKMGAVTPALAACGVADYRRLRTRVRARASTSEEARDIGVDRGSTLLVTESLNVDGAGVPIQFTQALFAADRIELVIDSGA